MDKLLLIDGNSLINRAFYALPLLSNDDGEVSNAVYGFSNILIKLIETLSPKYLAVAFDMRAPTFRHKMYDGYKATRKGMPEELASQMPILKTLLNKMNITYIEKEGYEADDILGTLSRKFDTENIILTADRDMLQLVNEHTFVCLTKKGVTETLMINEKTIVENFSVKPSQIVELKSLMGDSADNIPGIKGIGEKTAVELLNKYNNLDGVFEHLDEIKGKLKEKLETNKEMGYLSRTLATISCDAPIKTTLEELTYDFPFNKDVFEMFKRYQFKSLLRREELFSDKTLEIVTTKTTKIVQICDMETLKRIIQTDLINSTELAVHFFHNHLYLANSKFQEFDVKIKDNLLDDGLDIINVLNELKPIFENDKITKVCFDVKAFKRFLHSYDINLLGNYFDLCIAKHLISGSKKVETNEEEFVSDFAYTLEAVASAMLFGKGEYEKKIDELNLHKIFYDIEIPLINVLFEMEQNGFSIDIEKVEELNAEYNKEIASIKKEIFALAGEEFNINSPKQLGEILFDKLGLFVKGNTKKNTGAEILEKMVGMHPIIALVLRYRKLFKLNNTYVESFLNLVDRKSSIIHTIFNQTVTSTGRLSSTEPNLQNIPIREEEGKLLRKVFVSRFAGGKIVSADYSQIELRLMAHCSQDETLIKAYEQSLDIHAKTASDIFEIPLEQVTSDERRTAKAVNFGIIYGISDFGLSQNISISRKEAKDYIEKYFKTYPKVKEYMDKNVEDAKKRGYSVSIFGRMRKIDELISTNYMVKQFGERAAMNMPLQGTAADIVKIAMINVFNKMKQLNLKSKLILQIHDELIVDCEPSEEQIVKDILKQEMENAVKLSVPLVVDVEVGDNWYDAK